MLSLGIRSVAVALLGIAAAGAALAQTPAAQQPAPGQQPPASDEVRVFPQKGAVRERGPAGRRADETQREPTRRVERRAVPLREALELAARQGPDVALARAQAGVAAIAVDRYWTAWKPDITASGTFDHTSAPAVFDIGGLISGIGAVYGLPAPPPGSLPKPITIVGANSTYGTLQIAQPLLTPAGLFLKAPAAAAAEAAARGSDEAREQVLLVVARTYLGLKGLEGLLEAARGAEQVALRREADANVQISAGTAVEIALLRAQTETAQARAQIAGLEGQRESLLALLEGLVGEPIAAQPSSNAEADLGTFADEAQTPWEQTYGVQAAIAQVKAAHGLVRYDDHQWLPTVAAIAKGNYNSNGGFSGQTTSYDLILNVSIPLYDRGQRYVAKREDEAKLSQAQANLAATRARARSTWAGARANLGAAEAVLRQADSQAALARKAQQQIEVAAKAGVATSLDLSDADNRRFGAESAAAQARANLDVRHAELAAAEGRLFKSIAGR